MLFVQCKDAASLEVNKYAPEEIVVKVKSACQLFRHGALCYNCKWFAPFDDPIIESISDTLDGVWIVYNGSCHRNPPTFMPALSEEAGLDIDKGWWPYVNADDWCGEFTKGEES